MATYSLSNFLATIVPGDKTLKIYNNTKKLICEVNPNISYFFTKSNISIIRVEDKNDIYLDFPSMSEAVSATAKLNEAKKQITQPLIPMDSGELSQNEQRKLAYFHALSKTMTDDCQKIKDTLYKSSHNVRMQELWASEIIPSSTYEQAVYQSTINYAVTIHSAVTLTQITSSNGQAWYYNNGSKFVRPWIDPVDVPFLNTNLPSDGFRVSLYRGNDATRGIPGSRINELEGAWIPEYYAGIIHFAVGNTPQDLGWGNIKATFFEYTGTYGISGLTSAFSVVVFDSGTNQLIFNSGLSSETIVDLSPLTGGTGGLISSTNINMAARTTTGDEQLACLIGVTSTPLANSYISVYVNGVQVSVGDGVKTEDCYFSDDNGITAKEWVNIGFGDKLYWNGSVIGYQLNSMTDKISFIYLTP